MIDAADNKNVFSGSLIPSHEVDHWTGRVFWTGDFSNWQKPGHYVISVHSNVGDARSCYFAIDQ
ncbi:MAG: cellulase N-terminal Ig-like domain-containing protein, partial [Bryobacteraceae bacterium]